MKTSRLNKLLALAMAFVFPVSAFSADLHGAMFFVTSTAIVNGSEVNHSTAIFVGDKLQLPSDSSASITSSGTSVIIGPGSTVTYKGKTLELDKVSGVVVKTSSGVAVQVEKLTIAPALGKGRYQVSRAGGTVLIAANSGPVSIFDGASTRTVAEGTTEALPDPVPDDTTTAPGTKGGGTGVSKKAVAVGLGVAAIIAAVAIGTTGGSSRAAVSPTTP